MGCLQYRSSIWGIFVLNVCLFFIIGVLVQSLEASRNTKKSAVSRKVGRPKKPKKQSESVQQQQDEEAFYDQVWQLFSLGSQKDKKDAVSRLRSRLKKDPTNPYLHYYLGLMKSELGALAAAEEHLKVALTAFPQSTDILVKLGDIVSQKRSRQAEAIGYYEQALSLDPNNVSALSALGLYALDNNDFAKAIDLLSRAKAAESENPQVLVGLGKALFNQNMFNEAIANLKAALAFDEKNAECYWLLGKCYEKLNKPKEAAENLEKAKTFGKKDYDLKKLVGYDLARALNDMGMLEEALEEYKKAVRIATEPAIGWFEMGSIYENRGSYDKAIDAYKKAYEIGQYPEAVYRIGKIYREMGKLSESIAAFEVIRKRQDEWGTKAQYEIEEIKEEMANDERDRLMDIASDPSASEAAREKALLQMLQNNKEDEYALDGMRQLCLARGDYDGAKKYIALMKKYGYMTSKEAESELQTLKYKSESGEDIAEIESRIEECKKNGDWDGAIALQKRLINLAYKWQEYWANFNPKTDAQKEEKEQALRNSKWRIKSLKQDLKDLYREKKKYK